MPTSQPKTEPAELSENQRKALISLLADEDAAIYHQVREKLLTYGDTARPWLKPHTLSSDPALRRRSAEIIEHLDRQVADNDLVAFCLNQGEDLDLEKAIWLLCRTRYPQINTAAYEALLDSMASDLRERFDPAGSAESILAPINELLFATLGYEGDEKDYYDPENSYLNRVLDRRVGNPISLCLVYLFLARRLKLPIRGIAMPGHFLCRFQNSTEEYYIDAFNKGKLLTRSNCIRYLLHSNHGFQETHLAAATPRRILLRVCANLHQIYSQLKHTEEAQRVQRYLVVLAR